MTAAVIASDRIAGILERIAAAPASDDGTLLAALVAEIRPRRAGDAAQALKNLRALQYRLAVDPLQREALRTHVRALLAAREQTELFAEFGILPGTGFFTEAGRRLMHRLLPPLRDPRSLLSLFRQLFDRRDDHVWVESLPDAAWIELFDQLGFTGAALPGDAGLDPLLESLRVIGHRIAALGLEPDLVTIRPELRRHESPFLAQCAETLRFVEAWRRAAHDPMRADEDEQHILVLLDQCEAVIARVRRGTGDTGIGIGITYALQRLQENIERQRALLALLAIRPDADRRPAAAALLRTLVRAASTGNALREHVARSTELLALEVTEHSGRTGEHYIANNVREYRHMARAALGAGLIVPFMALVKLGTTALHAAPLLQGLLYSLNYALGFVLIQVLHFTLATKQPAMTATRIAQALEAAPDRKLDLAPLTELIVRVIRTQFIAIVGNVVLALPLAFFLARALALSTGMHPAGEEKALHLLHDVHPWASLALFHAAIAGVFLFLSGLISGYFDNLAVYRKVPARIAQMPRLVRLLGEARTRRLSRYVEHNLGGLAGNIAFGFMLGLTGVIGFNLGLPLDIRHVTFAAANFGIAADTLAGSPWFTWQAIGICALGIALIGAANLTVSFTLALMVAMKARRVRFRHARPLVAALCRRFLRTPLDFFRPPRAGGS